MCFFFSTSRGSTFGSVRGGMQVLVQTDTHRSTLKEVIDIPWNKSFPEFYDSVKVLFNVGIYIPHSLPTIFTFFLLLFNTAINLVYLSVTIFIFFTLKFSEC